MIMKSTFFATILLSLTFICCNTEEIIAHEATQTIDVIEMDSGTSNTLQEAITSIDDSGTIIIKGKIIIDESKIRLWRH